MLRKEIFPIFGRSPARTGHPYEKPSVEIRGAMPEVENHAPQHFLYFLPLPQGQGSLRRTFCPTRTGTVAVAFLGRSEVSAASG